MLLALGVAIGASAGPQRIGSASARWIVHGAGIRWGRSWVTKEQREFGEATVHWNDLATELPRRSLEEGVAFMKSKFDALAAMKPTNVVHGSLATWGTIVGQEAPAGRWGIDQGFGWPVPCLWYTVMGDLDPAHALSAEWTVVGGEAIRGAISFGPPKPYGLVVERRFNIPTRVIWKGLLINSGAWAAIVWVVAGSWRLMTRARRSRRGLCPGCGYSRVGLDRAAACPECGERGSCASDKPASVA